MVQVLEKFIQRRHTNGQWIYGKMLIIATSWGNVNKNCNNKP